MTDNKKMKAARETFDVLCKMLDDEDFRYDKDEDRLNVTYTIKGEVLAHEYNIYVDEEKEVAELLCKLPIRVRNQEKIEDVAVAISAINYSKINGSFDYNIKRGTIVFRMAVPFCDSHISTEAMKYMVFCSASTVEDHALDLMMLIKDKLTLEDFKKTI